MSTEQQLQNINSDEHDKVLSAIDDDQKSDDKQVYRDEQRILKKERLLDEEIKDKRFDRKMKKRYALAFFFLACISIAATYIIIFLVGYENKFNLESRTLIVLMSTVTVKVIGILYVMARHIFPERSSKDSVRS